jgi:hypothetical protein
LQSFDGALPIQTLLTSSISKATAKRSQSSQAHVKFIPYQKCIKNTKLNTLLVLTLQQTKPRSNTRFFEMKDGWKKYNNNKRGHHDIMIYKKCTNSS